MKRLLIPAALSVMTSAAFSTGINNPQLVLPDLTGEQPVGNDHEPLAETRPDTGPDLSGAIYRTAINKSLAPRVFLGYRHMPRRSFGADFPDQQTIDRSWRELAATDTVEDEISTFLDSLLWAGYLPAEEKPVIPDREDLPVAFGSATPQWLSRTRDTYDLQEDFVYSVMIDHPELIEYAYWDLPVPPRLPKEDQSFRGFLKKQDLPAPIGTGAVPVPTDRERINWLHTFNIGLQLSQAYVSGNWYQGGNSYLAFLGNFLWDVQLNPVYHPKLIFQSTVSYKLAINSTPDDECHKYSVSQDLFQYNLKAGYKAVNNWYYSFLAQFKTQFMNSYPANSMTRTASFLSPGELNLGLGMTYSKENAKKTLKFSASISPVSYNLKTCIDQKVDHAQFGILQDRKWVNEVGSNAELNFYAKIWGNTTYTTRLFIFSDYRMLQTDWENTLNFQFSRVFSTQIYAHLRYDTSADSSISRQWRKLMLKEILSVGISYTFSTK